MTPGGGGHWYQKPKNLILLACAVIGPSITGAADIVKSSGAEANVAQVCPVVQIQDVPVPQRTPPNPVVIDAQGCAHEIIVFEPNTSR